MTTETQQSETNLMSMEDIEKMRMEQNLLKGVFAGIAAGIIGAILWGVITVATGYQIGYMAIGIGALVGFAIRFFGRGIDIIFGILGGLIAFLSCVLGNFLSIVGFVADSENLGYFETLSIFNFQILPDIMMETFSFMDILFYGLAIYMGFKFSLINTEPETE